MIMKRLKATTAIVAIALSGTMALSDGYGPFPVTLQGYSGDKTNTVSYSCLLYTSPSPRDRG